MDARQPWRLKQLQSAMCSTELVQELYGLDLRDNALLGRFRAWADRFWRGERVEQQGAQWINRHALETFFQFSGLVPIQWAAVETGMDKASFTATLDALQGDGLPIPVGSINSEQIVEERLVRNLHSWFPSLRHRIFANHDTYCAELHAAIAAAYPRIEVNALRCITSVALGEDPADYANAFDAITLEPVGLRYQVWLDFKKPANLRPDCCSLKLYASERYLLAPHVMRGDEPAEIPPGLLSRRASITKIESATPAGPATTPSGTFNTIRVPSASSTSPGVESASRSDESPVQLPRRQTAGKELPATDRFRLGRRLCGW